MLRRRFKGVPIDALYSSDSYRSIATIEPIAKERGLPILTRLLLREITTGIWEDMAWGNIAKEYPEANQAWTETPWALKTPGASSFQQVSDRLIFESMNEVGFDDLRGPENYEVLNKINQEFVNLIRSSGGNNPKRHLLIAGYYTDITMTCSSNFKMPDDPENRCILSLHYYTPWQFCTTTQQRNWGTEAEVEEMKRLITNMTDKFTDNGIPVIIGEYGTARGNDEPSRVYFSETFVKLCHENNIPAFLWDNGSELDRGSLKWQNPELPKALNRAVSDKNYTPAKYD